MIPTVLVDTWALFCTFSKQIKHCHEECYSYRLLYGVLYCSTLHKNPKNTDNNTNHHHNNNADTNNNTNSNNNNTNNNNNNNNYNKIILYHENIDGFIYFFLLPVDVRLQIWV